jgi:hypothetical protein
MIHENIKSFFKKEEKPKESNQGFNVQNIVSSINKSGVASSSHFEVHLPDWINSNSRELLYRADSANLPGRTVMTTEHKFTNYGPINKVPYGQIYGDVTITFLLSEDLREKDYFETWQSKMIDTGSNNWRTFGRSKFNVEYFDNYSGSVDIRQYGSNGGLRTIHTLREAYPIMIGDIAMAWGTDEPAKLSVTFAYRNYKFVQVDNSNQPGVGISGSINWSKGKLSGALNIPGFGHIFGDNNLGVAAHAAPGLFSLDNIGNLLGGAGDLISDGWDAVTGGGDKRKLKIAQVRGDGGEGKRIAPSGDAGGIDYKKNAYKKNFMKALPSWKKRNLDRVTDSNRDFFQPNALEDNLAVWDDGQLPASGNATEYKKSNYSKNFMKAMPSWKERNLDSITETNRDIYPPNTLRDNMAVWGEDGQLPASGDATEYTKGITTKMMNQTLETTVPISTRVQTEGDMTKKNGQLPASGDAIKGYSNRGQNVPWNMEKLKNESQWKQRKEQLNENWMYGKEQWKQKTNDDYQKWKDGKNPSSGNATEYSNSNVIGSLTAKDLSNWFAENGRLPASGDAKDYTGTLMAIRTRGTTFDPFGIGNMMGGGGGSTSAWGGAMGYRSAPQGTLSNFRNVEGFNKGAVPKSSNTWARNRPEQEGAMSLAQKAAGKYKSSKQISKDSLKIYPKQAFIKKTQEKIYNIESGRFKSPNDKWGNGQRPASGNAFKQSSRPTNRFFSGKKD